MDDEIQKIIENQLKILPPDVKQAIVSVDYKTKLQEITKRQKLLIDQAAILETETTLVMIGLEQLNDYVTNLQKGMSVSIIRAQEVAMDVSENIFKPIRLSLQSMGKQPVNNGSGNLINETEDKTEPPVTKFTNSNETSLNRDQILKEIENPDLIEKGDQSMNFVPPAKTSPVEQIKPSNSTELEVRPAQVLETIPGEEVKNIVEEKMTKPTITSQQIVEAVPEIKLPEVKKKPSSGVDPYREPII